MSTTDEHTEAHRPHVTRRRRLVPLGLLVTCVVGTAVAGALHGGPVSAGAPPVGGPSLLTQTARAAHEADRSKSSCQPGFKDVHRTEPWVGAKRAASERTFKKNIKGTNPIYVKGKKGWVFYSDLFDNNVSQSVGRVTQSAKLEKSWVKYFAKTAKKVKAEGSDFRIVVSPADWDIYPQRLPSWLGKLRGTTTLEHLMADHPELPWIDTRSVLQKAAKKHDTYEALNSHWTPYGGWVAWKAITKCLRTSPALKDVREPAISGVGIEANDNEFVAEGVPDGKPSRTYPIFTQAHPATSITHIPDGAPVPTEADGSVDQVYTPALTVTPGAISQDTALILRDSTGNALSPLWDWSFAKTWSYQHGISQDAPSPDVPALVAQYHPNVVLYVITERFFDQPAPKP